MRATFAHHRAIGLEVLAFQMLERNALAMRMGIDRDPRHCVLRHRHAHPHKQWPAEMSRARLCHFKDREIGTPAGFHNCRHHRTVLNRRSLLYSDLPAQKSARSGIRGVLGAVASDAIAGNLDALTFYIFQAAEPGMPW